MLQARLILVAMAWFLAMVWFQLSISLYFGSNGLVSITSSKSMLWQSDTSQFILLTTTLRGYFQEFIQTQRVPDTLGKFQQRITQLNLIFIF